MAHKARGGFPLRFKIELADDPDMTDAVTLVDRTTANVENPGRHPMVFRPDPTAGRYLRFTSTRHFHAEDAIFWALEEIVILSGNTWVGLNRPTVASSTLELFPNWALARINNGMSALGMPVRLETSPSSGYLSDVSDDLTANKWLAVDLGEEHDIDEIRLVPVEAENFEVLGRRALPRTLTVEVANDPGFEAPTWSAPRSFNHPSLPGGCALVVPAHRARGRYVRLVARELWGQADHYGFGLAEFQVYAEGQNVALGKPVTVSDQADAETSPGGWAPEFAVDGFNSRHRLVEWPQYLALAEQRRILDREHETLLRRRQVKVRAAGLILGYGSTGIVAAITASLGVLLVRQRKLRQRAVARLRDQIARDLHDDIGSNLGGIVLLSEMGSRHSEDEQAREDFAAIKEAADETVKSMQDIVWLIGSGHMGLRDLVTRMRQATQTMLGDREVSLWVDPPDFREQDLSLLFRRHLFFAFKETLNNIRRHAGAATVEVRIMINASQLTFSVRDDGVGFDTSRPGEGGHGLTNLERRAARLHGNFRVESQPGAGTLVIFKALLKA